MKLGLKLWSINTDFYLQEAKRLYQEGLFDYIELYVVPNTIDTIKEWQKLNIPFTLHAPHFMHDVNLADSSKEKFNIEIFKQVEGFSDVLNAQYVVVHSGLEGNIEETIRQLKIIKPKKILIENKPYIAPSKKRQKCRGATIEEINRIIKEIGCGFCLDIGHAICTANSLDKESYSFLAEFNKLNPTCYHLSDNFIESEIDSHMNLGQGSYDFKRIFDIIDTNKNIAIETKKKNKKNLNDFIEDVIFLHGVRIER